MRKLTIIFLFLMVNVWFALGWTPPSPITPPDTIPDAIARMNVGILGGSAAPASAPAKLWATEAFDFSTDIDEDENWNVFTNGDETYLEADGAKVTLPAVAGGEFKKYIATWNTAASSVNHAIKIKFGQHNLILNAWQSAGVVFRCADAAGEGSQYQTIISRKGASDYNVNFDQYTGVTFVDTFATSVINLLDDNDWVGFSVTGTGASTVFKYWDFGGSDPGAYGSWGTATIAWCDGGSGCGGTTSIDFDDADPTLNTGNYVGFFFGTTDSDDVRAEFLDWVGGDQP